MKAVVIYAASGKNNWIETNSDIYTSGSSWRFAMITKEIEVIPKGGPDRGTRDAA